MLLCVRSSIIQKACRMAAGSKCASSRHWDREFSRHTVLFNLVKIIFLVKNLMPIQLRQGLPLSLSGVRRIMEAMDWGDIVDFVSFGQVGADQIDAGVDHYILICPQNVVGSTIMTNLLEMVRWPRCLNKRQKHPPYTC